MTQVQFPGTDNEAPPPFRQRGLNPKTVVIVCVVALVAFLAWAGARGPHDDPAPSAGVATTTTAAPSGGESSGGAASEPAGKASPASQRWAAGGTKATKVGVPVGYPQTEDGAAAAATNYLVATGGTGIHLDEKRWTDTVDAVLLDPKSSEVAELHEQAIAYLKSLGIDDVGGMKGLASTFEPVSVSVVASSRSAATVNVWGVSVFGLRDGAGGNGPVAAWETWQVKVRWDGGDWRLANGVGEKLHDGPTPAPNGAASPAGDVVDAVNGGAR